MPVSDLPLPKSPHDRERDRWTATALNAVCSAGKSQEHRRPALAYLLHTNFSDVPDKAPSPDDVRAYAAFAVKVLLQTLIDNREKPLEQLGEKAQSRFAEVVQGLTNRELNMPEELYQKFRPGRQ
jgi:hypothetical protein